jgi:hypothetical protein
VEFRPQILPGEPELLANSIAETRAIQRKRRTKKTIQIVGDFEFAHDAARGAPSAGPAGGA